MPVDWGAIAQGALQASQVVTQAISNKRNTKRTISAQLKQQQMENDFNERMIDKMNEYNSPANQKRLADEARINPYSQNFMQGATQGTAPTSASADVGTTMSDSNANLQAILGQVGSIPARMQELALMHSERDLMKKDLELREEDLKHKRVDNEYFEDFLKMDYHTALINSEILQEQKTILEAHMLDVQDIRIYKNEHEKEWHDVIAKEFKAREQSAIAEFYVRSLESAIAKAKFNYDIPNESIKLLKEQLEFYRAQVSYDSDELSYREKTHVFDFIRGQVNDWSDTVGGIISDVSGVAGIVHSAKRLRMDESRYNSMTDYYNSENARRNELQRYVKERYDDKHNDMRHKSELDYHRKERLVNQNLYDDSDAQRRYRHTGYFHYR